MAPQNKMSNARRALIQAGMSRSMARDSLGLLDLDQPLKPQIIALAEEEPELFGLDADGNPIDKGDDKPKPQTALERKVAALRGEGNPHVHKRKARPKPESTATKSAQELAEFFTSGKSKDSAPPTPQWRDGGPRDLNAGHAPLTREPSAGAKRLAARLRGN